MPPSATVYAHNPAAPLEIEAVFDLVLSSASRLLDGQGGSIMLLTAPGELEVVAAPGNEAALGARVRFGEGVAGKVAQSLDPVLVAGRSGNRSQPVDSGLCVPLVHGGSLFGVLNINARPGRRFSDHDLEAAAEFATRAADALAEARLYEIARRDGHEGAEHHLTAMLEHLAAAGSVPVTEPLPLVAVDAAAVAREVMQASGATNGVRGPETAVVLGRRPWLERAIRELVDNGRRHGEPPVRVIVEVSEATVTLSVADSGPGVPPADRERVFEPFVQLDGGAAASGGLGLGLTIARRCVEAMGGHIDIVDTPVGGTAARIRLRRPPTA